MHTRLVFLLYFPHILDLPSLALILVPTREFALQTSNVVMNIGKHMKVSVTVLLGGIDLKEDIVRLLNKPHVIVATPGRVLHSLCNKRVAELDNCKLFVLDEADKLLSEESVPIIQRLLSYCPQESAKFFAFPPPPLNPSVPSKTKMDS